MKGMNVCSVFAGLVEIASAHLAPGSAAFLHAFAPVRFQTIAAERQEIERL